VAATTGLGVDWAAAAILAGAVALAIPFAVGLLRSGRRLGRELAERALPRDLEGLDLAAEPRRAMTTMLELAVVLVAVSLYVTATQPVLPAGGSLVVVGLALAAFAWAFWRTSEKLDGHVRAGAQAFAEALLRPLGSGGFEDVENLLPGLGDLTGLVVPRESQAAGRTLAELDLRGRTGATVLAVRRGDETHELPGAGWRIEAGDLLGLTGSHEAVAMARRLLTRPAQHGAARADG
jgi:CPA2 family monovalent cation:H+ antiporter-2